MTDEEMVDRATNYYIIMRGEAFGNNKTFIDQVTGKEVDVDYEFLADIDKRIPQAKENADDFHRQVVAFAAHLMINKRNHTHFLPLRIAIAQKLSEDFKRKISYTYTQDRPYNSKSPD